MAELFNPNVDFSAQTASVTRQQKLAEYLRKQAEELQANVPTQGSMVGGHWIAPSAAKGLQAGLAQYLAGNADTQAQKAEQQMLGQQAQAAQQWRENLPQPQQAQPGMAPNYVMESPEGQAGSPAVPYKPVDAGTRLRATMAGLANPATAKEAMLWNQGMAEETAREDTQQARREAQAAQLQAKRDETIMRLEQQAADAKRRSEDLQASIEQRRQANADSIAARLQIAQLMRSVGSGAAADRQAARQERTDERHADKVDKQITALSNAAKTVAPMVQTAKTVQDMLDEYDNKSIPGIGYEGLMPGMLLSKQGVVNRAKVKAFANAMLRNQAGLSQTLSETENANLELLANGKFSEKEFRAIWPTLMDKINATTNTVTAGYLPEVVKTVRSRGAVIEPVVSRLNKGSAGGGWKVEEVK